MPLSITNALKRYAKAIIKAPTYPIKLMLFASSLSRCFRGLGRPSSWRLEATSPIKVESPTRKTAISPSPLQIPLPRNN